MQLCRPGGFYHHRINRARKPSPPPSPHLTLKAVSFNSRSLIIGTRFMRCKSSGVPDPSDDASFEAWDRGGFVSVPRIWVVRSRKRRSPKCAQSVEEAGSTNPRHLVETYSLGYQHCLENAMNRDFSWQGNETSRV